MPPKATYPDRTTAILAVDYRDERGRIDVADIVKGVERQARENGETLGSQCFTRVNHALDALCKNDYIRKKTDRGGSRFIVINDVLRRIITSFDLEGFDGELPITRHRAICLHFRLRIPKIHRNGITKAQYAEYAQELREELERVKEEKEQHEKECPLALGGSGGQLVDDEDENDMMDVDDDYGEGSSTHRQARPSTPTRPSPPPPGNTVNDTYPTPRSPTRASSANSTPQTPTRGPTPGPSMFPGNLDEHNNSNDMEEDHVAQINARPAPQTPIRPSGSLYNPAAYPSPTSEPRKLAPRTSPPPLPAPETPTRQPTPEAGPSGNNLGTNAAVQTDNDMQVDHEDNEDVSSKSLEYCRARWSFWKEKSKCQDVELQTTKEELAVAHGAVADFWNNVVLGGGKMLARVLPGGLPPPAPAAVP